MIKPILNNVLVELIESKRTESGLILAGNDDREIRTGKVISVGPGVFKKEERESSPSVAVGEKVLFKTYSSPIPKGLYEYYNESTLYIITNEEILAIIE